MISKKNKYIKHVLTLLILSSCSTTSENLITSSNESISKDYERDLRDINAYDAFFLNDLEILKQKIDNQKISQSALGDIKLLKKLSKDSKKK